MDENEKLETVKHGENAAEQMAEATGVQLVAPQLRHGEYPGAMVFADVRGHFPGCQVKEFRTGRVGGVFTTAADKVNEFFKTYRGLIVVDMKYALDDMGDSYILVTFTKFISPEEQAENDEIGELMRVEREKRAKAREEAKAAEAAKLKAANVEFARLADVGRKCEANHGKQLGNAPKEERHSHPHKRGK